MAAGSSAPSHAIQIADPAESSAPSFDGMCFSAIVLTPLLPVIMSSENATMYFHSRFVAGNRSLSTSATAVSSAPASTNRPAEKSSGGNPCTPSRIARNVEPQIR